MVIGLAVAGYDASFSPDDLVALLLNSFRTERILVVWLGGCSRSNQTTRRILFSSDFRQYHFEIGGFG